MLPNSIQNDLQYFHGRSLDQIKPVGGGSINEAFRYEVNEKDFFIKYNKAGSKIIAKEVDGLEAIKKTNTISVPEIHLFKDNGEYEFLVLELIRNGTRTDTAWQNAGELLAAMHNENGPYFGWKDNNFIGSSFQQNDIKESFISFFIENRLTPQIKWAEQQGFFTGNELDNFELLFKKLPSILPDNIESSLVHGDLWGGNFMIGENAQPYLIDPSIHYNFRETDIAFTHLFGGFDQMFYESYQSNYPLAPEFESRIPLYNLYPLLVHLNLFGSGYYSSVIQNLNVYM